MFPLVGIKPQGKPEYSTAMLTIKCFIRWIYGPNFYRVPACADMTFVVILLLSRLMPF
jgi:hypothetical protein